MNLVSKLKTLLGLYGYFQAFRFFFFSFFNMQIYNLNEMCPLEIGMW